MRLDRSKPFGKISGETFIPDGCDRPAFYEQHGKMFDAHDRLIVPGVAADALDEDETIPEDLTVVELLRQAEAMSLRKLKAAATIVLGPTCPTGKSAIIEALRGAQAEFDARATKRGKQRAAAAPEPEKASVEAESEPDAPVNGVDLASWARGQKEYLWAEVRKAIKTKYGRNVGERDDAVEFLIGQGVVRAEHARQDVIRDATA